MDLFAKHILGFIVILETFYTNATFQLINISTLYDAIAKDAGKQKIKICGQIPSKDKIEIEVAF